jgi:DNA modification methylase
MFDHSTLPSEVLVVAEFPSSPKGGIAYSLAGAKKSDVSHGTHSAHKYPAKFIPQIPRWAIQNLTAKPNSTVLDPFCGSGTSLVEAGRLGHRGLGADISPLATLMTRAKCALLPRTALSTWKKKWAKAEPQAKLLAGDLEAKLKRAKGTSVLGLHHTWSNWFEPAAAAGLLAIRATIQQSVQDGEQKDCALTALSSIVKACSYLNEDQIKVRYEAGKAIADPFPAFAHAAAEFIGKQVDLSAEYERAGAAFGVYRACASLLPLEKGEVDLMVTSPPYINAVDYTMTHKYNLFVLGLLEPEDFKAHCREYIGVTERAVRATDLTTRPESVVPAVRDWITRLDELQTATAANRAYVVTQYFDGMYASFVEAARVLKRGGQYFMVVGEHNRICGLKIPTASLIEQCAALAGFKLRKHFLHALANRSSMRLSRAETGGEIPFERVFIFER